MTGLTNHVIFIIIFYLVVLILSIIQYSDNKIMYTYLVKNYLIQIVLLYNFWILKVVSALVLLISHIRI